MGKKRLHVTLSLLALLCLGCSACVYAADIYSEHFNISPPATIGSQPSGWQDQNNTNNAFAEISYEQDGLARIEMDGNSIAGKVISPSNAIQITKNTMIDFTVVEVHDATLTMFLHYPGATDQMFPGNTVRTRVSKPGTYTHTIFNLVNFEGPVNFQVRFVVTGLAPSYAPGYAIIDSVRIYPFTLQLESDGSYFEDFNWQQSTVDRGWSTGDGNAEITPEGTSNLKIRFSGNVPNQEYGDVMSPIISNFDPLTQHTLEIKVDRLSPGTSLDLQIQAAGISDTQVDPMKKLAVAPYTYSQRIDGLIGNNAAYENFVVKIWINGNTATSEASIDYLKIYAKPPLTPTPVSEKREGFVTPYPFAPRKNNLVTFHLSQTTRNNGYSICIMNIKGQIVKTLTNTDTWDGRSDNGHVCEGGVYVYQIKTAQRRFSGKLVIIK